MLRVSDNFIRQCIETFPKDQQIDILQEECAELIQALSKLKRGKVVGFDMTKEEMAHVLISLSVVAEIIGISEEDIQNEVAKKAKKINFTL